MEDIWIIGAGEMTIEYVKVLQGLNKPFIVIGRGEKSAAKFEDVTNIKVIRGGVENFLIQKPPIPKHAIVVVRTDQLSAVTICLLNYGIKNILVEKPGALIKENLIEMNNIAEQLAAKVVIGYNRRFYSSTEKAKQIIEKDGGVTSFHFEFTEWGHIIEKLDAPANILEKWFLANSTHVVDLAFYLGGIPKQISCFTDGKTKWHKSASVFAGAGVTENGALFSYQANWEAPGRWSVEILTKKHRLIFRPMEALKIQNLNSIKIDDVEINNELDLKYKPGLLLQTKAFLENETFKLKTLKEQEKDFELYYKIANY